MADMGTYLQAVYDRIESLSGSIPYATLLDHHDFSAGNVVYPLVAIDFDRRRRSEDGMNWLYDIDILIMDKIETDGATPIKTTRLIVDSIVQQIDVALDGIANWPEPQDVETQFGFAEDGTIPLYFGLMRITTNWAR